MRDATITQRDEGSAEWLARRALAKASGGAVNYPHLSTGVSLTTSQENTLVDVTAGAGVVITIGSPFSQMLLKDRSGSNTPVIGAAAANGALMEDPNNLGNPAFFAATVFLKQPGGCLTFRYNGTIYECVGST